MAVTTIKSSDIGVYVGGVLVGCANTASLSVSREFSDAVCAATGAWRERIPAIMSWTLTIDALYRVTSGADNPTNVTADDLYANFSTGVPVVLRFGGKIGSTIPEDFYFIGDAYVEGMTMNVDYEGKPTWNVNFQGNGALTMANVAI
jgi:hypothetical protein